MPGRDQFAATQASSALEPAVGVVEGGEDGDGDASADREASQGGVEEVVDHALAQCEQRPVAGDGTEGHGLGASVRVTYLLGPAGVQAGVDEGLCEDEHADGVPVVGGGRVRGLPDGGARGADEGGGENHAGEPPPGAQAAGGGADAAPGIAPGPGHGAPAACSSDAGTGPASAAVSPIQSASPSKVPAAGISSCSLASYSLPARSGRMGRTWRRSGGNMAPVGGGEARQASPHQRRHEGRVARGGPPEPRRGQLAPGDEVLHGVPQGLRAIDHKTEPKGNIQPRQLVSVGNKRLSTTDVRGTAMRRDPIRQKSTTCCAGAAAPCAGVYPRPRAGGAIAWAYCNFPEQEVSRIG